MLRKSFWERLNILLVMLAMLVVFAGVVGAAGLEEKNLDKPFNVEAPDIAELQLEPAQGTFITPYPTAAQGDVVKTAVGDWSYWWHPGDYALGTRTTSLSSVNRLDYHMVITENVLNSGGHCDLEFYLNGIFIGKFQVLEGQFVKDLSFTFPPIFGPTYELKMVETNLVESGKGSFRLDSAKPGSVTLYEGGGVGIIKGTVTDAVTGKPIPEATVIAINVDTKEKTKAVTDAGGYYAIMELEPGNYLVLCVKKGYKLGIKKAKVKAGETTIVEFELTPK